MRISVVYLLMVFLLAACTQEPERTDVIDVPVNDPELNAATEKARAELHRFIDHIEAYPEDDSAQMKIPLETGDDAIENIWIDNVEIAGPYFVGNLANAPVDQSLYKYGDRVTIPQDEVVDWLWYENDEMIGGFTVKVLEAKYGRPGS